MLQPDDGAAVACRETHLEGLAQWQQGASWHRLADGNTAPNWHGLLLEGWQPMDDTTSRQSLPPDCVPYPMPLKLDRQAMVLCQAPHTAVRGNDPHWSWWAISRSSCPPIFFTSLMDKRGGTHEE